MIMKKLIITCFLLLLCLSCNSQKKDTSSIIENVYTFEEFKTEFQKNFEMATVETSYGTWFWDEFNEYETRYNLVNNESKLLGEWSNVTISTGPSNHYYNFFPNKFFLLAFLYKTIQINGTENLFLDKALGTWDITDGIVRFTVYAITIRDNEKTSPNNKDVVFIEHPYTVDFINIDDIGEEGFTKRPINDTILSEELQKQVIVLEPNKSNNLYVRTVYSMSYQPEISKYYGYFTYFPDMARENHSGLEIATNPELIKKYIPDWMF
jgi:hypothetical protein